MPITDDQILEWSQNYSQEHAGDFQQPANFGIPKAQTPEQQINAMPNADKLTKFERGVYGALPGITTWLENNRIMGRSISEQLDRFNNSWAGKALNSLDVLAEGLERTAGLVTQMATDPDFDTEDLRSAWYAGSLTYDTMNLPVFKRDDSGKIIGMRIPSDLPGSGGLSAARTTIQKYLDQGLDPKEALDKARDEYYNGLGALALRAQLNDTYGHILGDPLNFITAYLKPVQALKARRFTALTTKLTGGVDEFIQSANKASDLLKTASNADDALKLADEAFQFAQLAGNTKLAAKYGEQAAEIAKGLGKADEVGRYSSEAARLAGLAPEEAAKFSEDALRAIGKQQLNSVDKFAIMMTGGDPFRPSAFGTKFANTPVLGNIAKTFQLTPESKARELLTLVSDNIGANVIGRMMANPNAEAEFVSYMRRIGKGATGIEYGHAMMTMEGRTVQGFVKGVENDIGRMFQQYSELAPVRSRLDFISQALGETPTKLLKMMDDNPEAVMQMLAKYAPNNLALQQMLQTGELSADALKSIPKMLGNMPYNKEMFFAQAMDAIETAAMRQAVVQFGVKSKGLLTRWSDAIKSAESLAFLKLNPGYPIRNKLNNDMTMLSRGLFGFVSDQGIDDFWKGFGFEPKRLGKAELAQEISGASKMSEADKILKEAISGGNYGTPEKVKEFFGKINLGKADFAGYWGQKIETAASRKSYTIGTKQGLRLFSKNLKVGNYFSPKLLDEVEKFSPGFSRIIKQALTSSDAMDAKFDKILGTNLNLSVDAILDDVSEALGTDVVQSLGDEVLDAIRQGLPKAIEEGKVDSFIQQTRQQLNRHIEDLFQKQIENVVEHVKSQAAVGGPNVWNMKLSEAQDLFWGAHIEYSMRMPEATRLAREASSAGDFNAARSLWAKEAEDGRLFYDRAFRRVDAYIEGLEQGTKHLADKGVKLPFTPTKRTFQQWKGMWGDFHSTANKMKEDFFKAVKSAPAGKKPKWDDVQAQIDTMMDEAIAKEDGFMQQLDDTIANMIDDPQVKAAYMNARDALAELRRADKTMIRNIRGEIADLPKEQRQDRWNAFWQERAARYQEMRQVDAASVAIQQGDPQAMQAFSPQQSAISVSDATPKEPTVYDIANEFGIPSASASGARMDKRILNTINKYLPEGTEKFKNAADVPPDIARQAFEARAEAKGIERALVGKSGTQVIQPDFIADVKKVIPDQPPIDFSLDLMAYGKQYGALDEIVNGAKRAAQKTPTLLSDLPQNLQDEVRKSIRLIKNDFADTRYQAMKFGEWRRDSALLNYNRRTNFDSYLGNVAPFAFWSTSSMFQWAVESIDRPAALTTALRMKKLMATGGMERDGQASRTKGKIRIDVPFAPEWMGDQFVDPMRLLLPFDNWAAPFEQMQKDREGAAGRTTRVLDQMLQEGSISQEEYDTAVSQRAGSAWDFAEAQMSMNDQSDRYDAWDFGTAMASPHAPIMWAYNAAFGDKEDIGPFSPLSRIMRNTATMLGVEDWNNSKYNLEAKIRRQMGLNSYDKWDDYRIKRAASNLAGEGKLSPDEMKEAIAMAALVESGKVPADEAKKQSEAYRLSVERSNDEYTGGAGQFALGLLGISVTSVPKGEANLRALQNDFGQAYQKYDESNKSLEAYLDAHPDMTEEDAAAAWEKANPKLAKDGDALTEFFDKYPEYEGRLGLFDDPETTVQKFYVDQVWKQFNELPKLNQEEMAQQLGQEFQESFLNSSTRSYDSIPTDVMAVWIKLMGADPLGGLTADQRLLTSLYKMELTDPETANRVQTFYDSRDTNFKDYYKLQSGYYSLTSKTEKSKYLRENPELKQYWDFRYQFFRDNPDLVSYITDNPEAIEKARSQSRTQNAVPTAQEINANFSPNMQRILGSYFSDEDDLPFEAREQLEIMADDYGMTVDQLLNIVGGGQGIR